MSELDAHNDAQGGSRAFTEHGYGFGAHGAGETSRGGSRASEDGPNDEQTQRLATSAGLYWRTCDQCAKQAVCIVNGEAYICEECQEFHEQALNAAHDAIRETGLVPLLRDYQVDVVAWAAVKAYIEFTDEESADAVTT